MTSSNRPNVWNIPRLFARIARIAWQVSRSRAAYALSAAVALGGGCAGPGSQTTRAAPAPPQPPARAPHDATVEIGPVDITSPAPTPHKGATSPEDEPEASGVDALYHGCMVQCGTAMPKIDRQMRLDACLKEHTPCEQSPIWQTDD